MEYYVLIGIIFGIIAFFASFIHSREWKAATVAGNIVIVFARVLESALFGVVAVMLWAPALVIGGTIGLLAVVAG